MEFGPALNDGHGGDTGTHPVGFAVVDLTGDGRAGDLVVADAGSNQVSVLLGQGSGSNWTMTPGPRIDTDAGPVAVAVGHILGDGQPDLAVANQQADKVQVFPGAGGGFFNDQSKAVKTYAVGQTPSGLFLGHFSGSGTGIAALNAGSNSVTVIGPTGAEQKMAAGGLDPTTGFAGDFTGNGFIDLVIGNTADGHLKLLLGGADGRGGGLATVDGGNLLVITSFVAFNEAVGGQGGAGGDGGDGLGGGIYAQSSSIGDVSLTVTRGAIVANQTRGGPGGIGSRDGLGIGGGVYWIGTFSPDATVIAFNHASTRNDNVYP